MFSILFEKIKNLSIIEYIEIALIIAFCFVLRNTNATYFTYIVVSVLAILAVLFSEKNISKRHNIAIIIISIVFAIATVVSQYILFEQGEMFWRICKMILVIVGSFVVSYSLFKYGVTVLALKSFKKDNKYEWNNVIVFVVSTVVFFIFNFLILVLSKYPGEFQYDTLWQYDEILTGNYTNHHSFYHTLIVKLFIEFGKIIGFDITKSFFMYSIFQIVVVSLIVGYFMLTLNQSKLSYTVKGVMFFVLLIHPLNIKIITYILKDAFFAYFVLLFLVAFYRITKNIGKKKNIDYILMIIGAIGFGVFRSNGFVALFITVIVILFVKYEDKKKIVISLAFAVVIASAMKVSLLNVIGVAPTEYSEKFSIPIQQIGRVVCDDKELTQEEIELINELDPVENIKNDYRPECSDNIKGAIQFWENDKKLEDNKWDYLKLYVSLGLKYPVEYIKAYVDETSGYWALGYGEAELGYAPYSDEIHRYADLGKKIHPKTVSEGFNNFLNNYCHFFQRNGIAHIVVEIGLYFYALIYIMVIAIIKKNKTAPFAVPGICVILTLMVASPMHGEQRYAYAMYTCLCIAIIVIFSKDKEIEETK